MAFGIADLLMIGQLVGMAKGLWDAFHFEGRERQARRVAGYQTVASIADLAPQRQPGAE